MRAYAVRLAGVAFLCVAPLALAACENKNPVGARPPLPGPSSWLTITGTTVLNQPGDTSQLTVMLTSSDGTTKDVTRTANWSGGEDTVTIRGGLVTALRYGRGLITVTAEKATQSIPLRVLPEGMYLLQGRITAASGALAQARVEITSAAGTYSTVTNMSGGYSLPAAGAATVRVQLEGYQEATQQVTVDRDERVDFVLPRLAGEIGSILGAWVATFTASPSCTLPAPAMKRTYSAVISDGHSMNREEPLIVELTGANFVAWANDIGFTGWFDGRSIHFDITDDIMEDFAVIERIGSMDLHYSGAAVGTVSSSSIVTTFSGRLVVNPVPGPGTLGTCEANDHTLVLVR